MKNSFNLLLLICGLLFSARDNLLGDEVPAPKSKEGKAQVAELNVHPRAGKWHSIEVSPPPNLPKISIWKKLNPVWWFGNMDNPVPPDSYRPGDKHRVTKWYFRNPFHNFDFYVIGVADKTFVRSGPFPEGNGNPRGGWDFEVTEYKCLRLPFIAYSHGRFNFYWGWRNRGNFGVKFNFSKEANDKKGRVEKSNGYLTSPSESKALPVDAP